MSSAGKTTRRVFVIMPFVTTGTRNQVQLSTFFQNNIKAPIERATLHHRYEVYRSGQTFDITAEIIRDLSRADVVIADLSGADPNPNVMYELGVRLAVSEAPVILIREQHKDNRRIFDVIGFYTHEYDPFDYGALEKHLVEKLQRVEAGEEAFSNPVLTIVREELARREPDLTTVSPERQRELAVSGVRGVAENVARAFGPYGAALAVTSDDGVRLELRGADIAAAMHSSNPFEEAGIRAMATCAAAQGADGTKLAVLIARALIDGCSAAMQRGVQFLDVERHLASALDSVKTELRKVARPLMGRQVTGVAETAAKGNLDVDMAEVFETAGPRGNVFVESGEADTSSMVVTVDHPVFERGVMNENFVLDRARGETVLDNCRVLVTLGVISSVNEMVQVLSLAKRAGKPLLLVAAEVEDPALGVAAANFTNLRCVPVKLPGRNPQASGLAGDIAVLTGASMVDPVLGPRLGDIREEQLGSAKRVVIGVGRTEIFGGGGSPDLIEARVKELQAAAERSENAWQILGRVAVLAGNIVTVRIGGATAEDIREKLYRTRSARSAFYTAVMTGVASGGGAALVHASAQRTDAEEASPVVRTAIEIARAALLAPFSALLPADANVPEILKQVQVGGPSFGYNVRTQKVEDLMGAGVVDPVGTIVRAIDVAFSSARAFLKTGAWYSQA